jgi:hypothetical protein
LILAFGYCGAALILAALEPSTAQAQTPAQPPPAQEPPAATPPPPHTFSGTATVGVSLETGRTDLTGVQVQIEGKRPYSTTGAFDGSFSYAYATAGAPGQTSGDRQTVADRLTASFDVEQNFGKRLVMMLRAQALRDPVAQIHYRIAESAGLGVRFGDKRVQVRLLPGVAFLNDDMHLINDGFRVHYGLYEDITATITPAWTFAHYLSISRNFSDSSDQIIALDAKLTGTVTRRFAIQLSYQYNYEKRLPPGVEPQYQKTTAGLQISF